jgi:hypothetical protein
LISFVNVYFENPENHRFGRRDPVLGLAVAQAESFGKWHWKLINALSSLTSLKR